MTELQTIRRLYRLSDQGAAMTGDFDAVARATRILSSASRRLSRYAETRCNGIERWDSKAGRVLASFTDDDDARLDRLEGRAEAQAVAAIAVLFGDSVTVTFQRDPRGAPIRLWLGAPHDSRSADALL